MGKIFIREATQRLDATVIWSTCAPTEPFPDADHNSRVWYAYSRKAGETTAVAFGLLRPVDGGTVGYLSAAGVLPDFRGRGIQRGLIRARVRAAKAAGMKSVITYTAKESTASMNNLIRCGFLTYTPQWRYSGREFIYWRKDL